VRYCRAGGAVHLDTEGGAYWYEEVIAQAARRQVAAGDGRVLAPMNGRIVAVHVAAGDLVARGQVVAVLEAMKMHCPVLAELAGRVSEVLVRPEAQVAARQLLVQITSGGAPA
jgi:geranyl-CoA carboxylase alpha subunit